MNSQLPSLAVTQKLGKGISAIPILSRAPTQVSLDSVFPGVRGELRFNCQAACDVVRDVMTDMIQLGVT